MTSHTKQDWELDTEAHFPIACVTPNADNRTIKGDEPSEKVIIPQPGSKFLSLPGEIRNIIYDHCSQPMCTWYRQYPGFATPRIPRVFYSLAQACRQTRTEFLPMYLQRTKARVKERTLPDYQKTFPQRTISAGIVVVYEIFWL
ncbi:hypothetical protein K491DRAFT_698032 [Lophiostoma macrostomum CBS 122681]|uniref:F-box domain-containing protein n=1 Tax=Lophiostoma macrostomum CBS 122681 TaxID=1314788 RepID=A0A6A6SPQ8_9PLEO|nr:hypothetical protein K491DRAFT_698032 [Lophiostoma macrostomum CBS 122681]